ncbi:MAG: hypothetical protein WC382_06005 [Methanoregulaceae archaeon]|jgi:hypothetical protein
MSIVKWLSNLISRPQSNEKAISKEKSKHVRYLYIVISDNQILDNPPETHFYSGRNAHQYARKIARRRKPKDGPVTIYKVVEDNYDLDLGDMPRQRYGIVAEWYYQPGKKY